MYMYMYMYLYMCMCMYVVMQYILLSVYSVLNQRGWQDREIDERLKRIEAGEDIAEEEGLYATYAMLHTYRKE